MPIGQEITLRLTIPDPVAGVIYGLQDKDNRPVDPRLCDGAQISFDVPVRLADGPRFLGGFVRSEGPARRFVYIWMKGTGDLDHISRRAKIDIHDIPGPALDEAKAGRTLEAVLRGREKDGTPACATVRPIQGWRAL